jgi:hypothetical protein
VFNTTEQPNFFKKSHRNGVSKTNKIKLKFNTFYSGILNLFMETDKREFHGIYVENFYDLVPPFIHGRFVLMSFFLLLSLQTNVPIDAYGVVRIGE